MAYFTYTKEEIEYISKKDVKLKKAILQIGDIKRECINDTYQALVNAIIGQQISTKAHATIWQRMLDKYGDFTVISLHNEPIEEIQKIGISMRKARYIKNLSLQIMRGKLDLKTLETMDDQAVCNELIKIEGIGIWTAEMIMLHAMQRKNIISYLDLGIIKGMRMLYRHQTIDKELFMKYKKRYEPYASIASIYLWAIAAGAIENLNDPAMSREKIK